MPEEISGYSIIASAIVHSGTNLILGEGWKNGGLVYVVALYNDGEAEWYGGHYFDAPDRSRENKVNARRHFSGCLADYWS